MKQNSQPESGADFLDASSSVDQLSELLALGGTVSIPARRAGRQSLLQRETTFARLPKPTTDFIKPPREITIMYRISTSALLAITCATTLVAVEPKRPNVVVIISDDQGVGDYGFMGNEVIETPSLDAMLQRSGYVKNFYVSPVCAPTRACLMTGRYNYRTRCVDTYVGRSMMDADETTLAEYLKSAGYKTGIYGKWHMGDNYPLRSMDQGFDDNLVHRGGGIGQPSDPIGAEGKYTDPTLFHNGQKVEIEGYCTDIFFDSAMDFIERQVADDKNFFTYIATNAPHGPFHDVPPELYEKYKSADLESIVVGELPPQRRDAELDKLARIAAMITNIDENVGRLFNKLDSLGISDDTIVIFLNDNGPNTRRYVGNMRGVKAHVDDGGIRSPLLFHWPAQVDANATSDVLSAHIDLLPTILDACDVDPDTENKLDGRSFLGLLTGKKDSLPTRQIVLQTHRGNVPQLYNHFAIHESPWKLVHPTGFRKETIDGPLKLELYNLKLDPTQQNNVADQNPKVLARLRTAYEDWFADVSSTRPDNYAPPRIIIGTDHEPLTVLTRQDWRHTQGRPWGDDSNGRWLLQAESSGTYRVQVALTTADLPAGQATITAGDQSTTIELAKNRQIHSTTMTMPAGKFSVSVDVTIGGRTFGPHQVFLSKQ